MARSGLTRLFRFATITDDRGVEHSASKLLRDVPLLPNRQDARAPLPLASRWASISLLLGVIGGMLVIWFGVGSSIATKSDLSSYAVLLVAIAVFGLGLLIHAYLGSRYTRPTLARRLVLNGLCASCDSRIARDLVEQDGCSICQTCGAAWRLPVEEQNPPCVQCGYDLSGLEGDGVGCVRCPECGSPNFALKER